MRRNNEQLEHNEDIQWKDWMGFRGIIETGYKFIRFPNSHESWFNPQDEKIKLPRVLQANN